MKINVLILTSSGQRLVEGGERRNRFSCKMRGVGAVWLWWGVFSETDAIREQLSHSNILHWKIKPNRLFPLQSLYRYDKNVITLVLRILPAYCSWISLHISCHVRSSRTLILHCPRGRNTITELQLGKKAEISNTFFFFYLASKLEFKKKGRNILFQLHSI